MYDESFRNTKPEEKQVLTASPQVNAARFSPCGTYLIAGCFDGQLRRYHAADKGFDEVSAVRGHGGWVEAFGFLPDASAVVSGDSWGKLQCWTLDEEPTVRWIVEEAHDGWIRSLDVDAKGERVATCGLDRKVRIRNARDGRLLSEFDVPDAETFCVRFHPTKNQLYCGDLYGRVHRWRLADKQPLEPLDASGLYLLHRLQDVGGARVIAFDAAGERIAVGGTRPKNGATVQGVPTVLVFDEKSGETTHEFKYGATTHCFVHDAVFHPDGYLIAVTSGTPGNGQLLFQAFDDEAPFFTHTKIPNCHSVSLHPDGKQVAVAATNKGSNGNGRRLNKDGEYEGNRSPIHILALAQPQAEVDTAKTG